MSLVNNMRSKLFTIQATHDVPKNKNYFQNAYDELLKGSDVLDSNNWQENVDSKI